MMTALETRLLKMATYPEYETFLDTPELAYEFNEFIKAALTAERLILDHFAYKDQQSKVREASRLKRRGAKAKLSAGNSASTNGENV